MFILFLDLIKQMSIIMLLINRINILKFNLIINDIKIIEKYKINDILILVTN